MHDPSPAVKLQYTIPNTGTRNPALYGSAIFRSAIYSSTVVYLDDFMPRHVMSRLWGRTSGDWRMQSRQADNRDRMPGRGQFKIIRKKLSANNKIGRQEYDLFIGREESGAYYVVPLLWLSGTGGYSFGPFYECKTQKEVAEAKRTIRALDRLGALTFQYSDASPPSSTQTAKPV